jgi:GNAT superfamily N-acetyltransferase
MLVTFAIVIAIGLFVSCFLQNEKIEHNITPISFDSLTYNETKDMSEFGRFWDRRIREYYAQDNSTLVAQVHYKAANGQIGIIEVAPAFRRQRIATQILEQLEDEFMDRNVSHIWAATSKGHYFWSKLPNYQYHDRVDLSVVIGGYRKALQRKQIKD